MRTAPAPPTCRGLRVARPGPRGEAGGGIRLHPGHGPRRASRSQRGAQRRHSGEAPAGFFGGWFGERKRGLGRRSSQGRPHAWALQGAGPGGRADPTRRAEPSRPASVRARRRRRPRGRLRPGPLRGAMHSCALVPPTPTLRRSLH